MTTMTETLAAHAFNFTFMICQCRAGEHTATMDAEAHAAHVAAALETAGIGDMADAWDDGYGSGHAVGYGVAEFDPSNPYRSTK